MDYCQALTLAGFIGSMMSKDAKQPQMTDIYGWLFTNENSTNNSDFVRVNDKEYKKMSKEEMDLEMQKERFKQFVKLHNEQYNK